MKNKLDEIMAFKREEVKRLEPYASELRKYALKRNDFRGFRAALEAVKPSLIAEIKKASPSAGIITENFDPIRQATDYQFGGAHALSILTDEKYFQGHLTYLTEIREKVNLPLLRKDFIVHRHQLYEASLGGADAILLIVAGLSQQELEDLYNEAKDLQFDALIEVHNLKEMDIALDLGADLIGINNRNLQTFEVSLQTTVDLAEEAPPDVLVVSESGIKTNQDVRKVVEAGADALLVGETLMKSQNIKATIMDLLNIS